MTRTTRVAVAAALGIVALAFAAGTAAAQAMQGDQASKYLELLRQDLRTQKTAIVTEAMDLTDAQSEVFWPIYDQFSSEMRAVWDGRIANIKEFAEYYERMTNEKAKELADRAFKLDEQRGKVLKKYYNRLSKDLNPMLAGRFVQVESAIYNLISVQLAAELPLMK